jgi:hypothetical protein
MDDIGLGLADLLVITFILGVTHAIASLVVEAFRRSDEHPLDEALRVLAATMQDEMPKIRELLHLAILTGGDDEEEDEPKRGKR